MFPNNDPVAFMVAFYGCLLAEVVPVPIEVPLTRKVRQQTSSQPSALWRRSVEPRTQWVLGSDLNDQDST